MPHYINFLILYGGRVMAVAMAEVLVVIDASTCIMASSGSWTMAVVL